MRGAGRGQGPARGSGCAQDLRHAGVWGGETHEAPFVPGDTPPSEAAATVPRYLSGVTVFRQDR